VLVFDGASPSFRAMSTGQPVRSDHLGQETVDRLTRRPGGRLDTGCEAVTQALRQRDDDDITLVLARIRPGVSGSR
jgi:hypothetical protein